jgi:hypothetical protein
MDDIIHAASISPLRRRLIDDKNMRRFSRETQRNYVRDVGRFATFVGRSPDTSTAEDLRRFQVAQREAGVAVPTMNGIVPALRFFFTHTLDRPDLARRLVRVTHPRKLPVAEHRGRPPAERDDLPQAPGGALRAQRSQAPRHDAPQRLAVSRPAGRQADQHQTTASDRRRGGASGGRRQAGRSAHAAPQLHHPPAGGRRRHPRHPGAARPSKLENTAFYTKVATRTVRTVTSPLDKLGIVTPDQEPPCG